MNFFKKTLGSLFPKEQQQQANNQAMKKGENQMDEDEIPQQIIKQLFELSCSFLKQSKKDLGNETLLSLYGLFKQAKQGDCNTPSPGIFDLKGKSKWGAWNSLKGMPSIIAMKQYIVKVNEADPEIAKKVEKHLNGDQIKVQDGSKKSGGINQGVALKKVEVVDYSDEYSHPYFKLIEKNEQISQISQELLKQKNNSPSVYPLHFAIDKERGKLVQKFLQLLTIQEIESMKDQQGTGILEYAQLIQNQEILQMVRTKLSQK